VVIVAGAVANPLTSALCLDLERRGYVVYVVAHTAADEHYIRSLSRADLVPLSLDLVDPYTAQTQLQKLQNLLKRDHFAFDGARPHKLNFVGLVLAPDTQSAPATVAEISLEEWSDVLNANVLNCIATTQLLLPAVIEHHANVLLLTPSVAPALQLPMHAMESTVYGALQGFSTSLAAELKPDGISLTHVKIGNIDIPSVTLKQRREGVSAPRFKPTPIRKLNDCVFDTLRAKSPPRILHIGRGSATYDFIGRWAPPAFIAWMMSSSPRPTPAFKEDLQSSSGSLTWDKVDLSEHEL
jgi:NAD(P)-dependent dehydrogenase (short-subunit alcohol dehydrogenase family)